MGHYDLPTMLGYVSRVTKSRDAREPGEGMVYIGHSMGTTAFLAMCSSNKSGKSTNQRWSSNAPTTTQLLRSSLQWRRRCCWLCCWLQ